MLIWPLMILLTLGSNQASSSFLALTTSSVASLSSNGTSMLMDWPGWTSWVVFTLATP